MAEFEGGMSKTEEIIINKRPQLVTKIVLSETFWSYLISLKVLRSEDREKIQYNKPATEQVGALLDYMIKRCDADFENFCKALIDTNQGAIVSEYLKPNLTATPSTSDCAERKVIKWENLPECVKKYRDCLKESHEMILGKLPKEFPLKHDIKSYVQLILHSRESAIEEDRRGFREHRFQRKKGVRIKSSVLFQRYREEPAPRSVLLLGSPGAGKTATAYHYLDRHTHGQLWSKRFLFILFVLLREVNIYKEKVETFQTLLFNTFGARVPDKEQEKILQYIEENQEEMLVILEGYDEISNITSEYPIKDPTTPDKISKLIANLIKGNIFPRARLLITSRLHCVDELQPDVHRVVELAGFTEKNLKQLAYNKLSSHTLADKILRYMHLHENILSLCGTPVNAVGLIDYIEWKASRQDQGEDIPDDVLPTTRACLLWLLVATLLYKHDRSLTSEQLSKLTEIDVLTMNATLLTRLSKLAYTGLFGDEGRKQVYEEEDLNRQSLTVNEVTECGLMSGNVVRVPSVFWSTEKLLLSFLHQTFQEELAASYLVKDDHAQLLSLAEDNNGTWDMVIQLSLGLYGDPICHKLMAALYPDNDVTSYRQRAEKLLQATWSSRRRNYGDAELYSVVCLAESHQYKECRKLKELLATTFNTLYLYNTYLTSGYVHPVTEFLNHLPDTCSFSNIIVQMGSEGVGSLMSTQGTTGVRLTAEYTQDTITEIREAITNTTTLKQLYLDSPKNVPTSFWNGFTVEHNASVECLGLGVGMLDGEIPATVYTSLTNFQLLHSLNITRNNIPCGDNQSPLENLKTLPSLRHLVICECSLCVECLPVVTELMLTKSLLWLDISQNSIGDGGAEILAQGLSDHACVLTVLRMADCDVTPVGFSALVQVIKAQRSLTHWDAGGNLAGHTDFSVLKDSTLTQLELPDCKLDHRSVCSLVQSLPNSPHLTWLDLSWTSMNDESAAETLVHVLATNHTVQALCMEFCDVTDDLMNKLTNALKHNQSLKLLNLGYNTLPSAKSIVHMIQDSRLQHLGINGFDLGSEGWTEVAAALIHNTHLVSCWVGNRGMERDLMGFLQTMQDYPSDGPLKHIFVRCERSALARYPLPSCLSFVGSADPFYVLSGLWYKPFPPDLTAWMIDAPLYIK